MEALFERIRSGLENDGASGEEGDVWGMDEVGVARWEQQGRARGGRGVSEVGEALSRATKASEKMKGDLMGARRQLEAAEAASFQVRVWMRLHAHVFSLCVRLWSYLLLCPYCATHFDRSVFFHRRCFCSILDSAMSSSVHWCRDES